MRSPHELGLNAITAAYDADILIIQSGAATDTLGAYGDNDGLSRENFETQLNRDLILYAGTARAESSRCIHKDCSF